MTKSAAQKDLKWPHPCPLLCALASSLLCVFKIQHQSAKSTAWSACYISLVLGTASLEVYTTRNYPKGFEMTSFLQRIVWRAALQIVIGTLFAKACPADESDTTIITTIYKHIRAGWENNEIQPSDRAEDGEYARRVALDVVGHIPSYAELQEYLNDQSPDKRRKFVDQLLDQEGYVRNWTTIWGNLLVGRANNRGGGRAPLDKWLRTAFYKNLPYDEFVRQLLTAEGESEDNGAVVFLASHLNDMQVPATAITARLFLGRQVQCTQCHNHPFNDWQQSAFWGMNAFFRATNRRGNPRNGVAISDREFAGSGVVYYEKRNGEQRAVFPTYVDGTMVTEFSKSPRETLTDFVLDPKKTELSEAIVNRMWGHFFGYGFTKPVDDMGPHNTPSHPELLKYLAKEFQDSRYDLKRLMRWITASDAYNLTSRLNDTNKIDEPAAGETPLFSHVYLKQFRAEQLYDSLLIATAADKSGRNDEQAEGQRRQWLQQFVTTFGTDENDEQTTFNGTIPQALTLMNGQLIRDALNGGDGSFLRRVLDAPSGRPDEKTVASKAKPKTPPVKAPPAKANAVTQRSAVPKKIETLFLVALSRKPSEEELQALNNVFQKSGYTDPIQGLQDVFWAVLNSNEFIINH